MNPLETQTGHDTILPNESSSDQKSNHNNDNSEDLHSLCSQISDLQPRSHSIGKSVKERTVISDDLPKYSCFKRLYQESVAIPNAQFKAICFESTQLVQEFIVLGDNSTFQKQSSRGTNNPWRRYGALRRLHQIGGYAISNQEKKERKNREMLVRIEKNSAPPTPPVTSQMTLNKLRDRKKDQINPRLELQIPKMATVDIASQKLAQQVKKFVTRYGNCLVESAIEQCE